MYKLLSVNVRYLHDGTFRHVVDSMRSLLSVYQVTPSELREASILAATMHMNENIQPPFIYMDEAKNIPPAIFGSGVTHPWTVGSARTGRFQCAEPNFTEQDKQAGLDKFTCICGAEKLGPGAPNRQKHTHTCNGRNWVFYHPKPEHCHTFVATGKGFDMCADCGMSDVYYNWAYNKKS